MKKQLGPFWQKSKPFKIPVAIASGAIVILLALWFFQQRNVDELQQKIDEFRRDKITTVDNINTRLTLEKDIVVIEKDKTTIQNGVYTTLIQALGGMILAIIAYVGWRNFKVAEDKQVTERFSQAIGYLGNEKIDIRLGGIYALEQIAIDSPKYHWTIGEILSAFIREKSPLDESQTNANNSNAPATVNVQPRAHDSKTDTSKTARRVTVDVQAAVTVLGRKNVAQDPQGRHIDLRKVNLPNIDIQELNLSGADLTGANLTGANLARADLTGANLTGANLTGADLAGADLTGANLAGANLTGANLTGADLARANLTGADLARTDLTGANLSGANLYRANLYRADLTGVNLDRANFYRANLYRADLYRADLSGADLYRADLSGANLLDADLSDANLLNADLSTSRNLTRKQLESARSYENAKLPDYLQSQVSAP